MELRHYWDILRRRWWLVAGLPALAAALTVALALVLPPTYVVKTTMLITQRPLATTESTVTLPDENNFNSWAASEYVLDDVPQLVETERFAGDVVGWIAAQHQAALDVRTTARSLSAERKHRTVYLTVKSQNPDHARWMAEAAAAMLTDNGLSYWQRANWGRG